MKITELQIGDWVFIKDYPIKGLPKKVKPEHFVRSLVDLEPIPLTTEILEKNGFEKQQFGNFIYENDDMNLRIEFYPKNINYTNGCYDYIDIEKGCVTITEMPIEFVHELQHALRLCGISKEIEL